MALNTQSPLPLYQQLADKIRYAIDQGVYAVGEKIPAEQSLAADYAIGRPTVRQATDLLVREGRLQRKRGSGTFVLPVTPRLDLFSLAGTSSAFNQLGLVVDSRLVQAPLLTDYQGVAAYQIKRLSCVEGTPVLYEVMHLDAQLFQGLEQHNLQDRSLSALVKEQFFLSPSSADQQFTIVQADDDIANLLAIDNETPLLHVARTLHFNDHQAAIQCAIYCRTDKYHFSQTIMTTPIPT